MKEKKSLRKELKKRRGDEREEFYRNLLIKYRPSSGPLKFIFLCGGWLEVWMVVVGWRVEWLWLVGGLDGCGWLEG